MELNVVCFLGVMILTVLIFKGIFCFMHCYYRQPWEESYLGAKGHSFLPVPQKHLVSMEIPMEAIERTSTPVPTEERMKTRTEHQSDV